jgi:hypothetical protein
VLCFGPVEDPFGTAASSYLPAPMQVGDLTAYVCPREMFCWYDVSNSKSPYLICLCRPACAVGQLLTVQQLCCNSHWLLMLPPCTLPLAMVTPASIMCTCHWQRLLLLPPCTLPLAMHTPCPGFRTGPWCPYPTLPELYAACGLLGYMICTAQWHMGSAMILNNPIHSDIVHLTCSIPALPA